MSWASRFRLATRSDPSSSTSRRSRVLPRRKARVSEAVEEVSLKGRRTTEGVVRAGTTVRRPVGAHSGLAHQVLRLLETRGFEGAPRFLGIDGKGREILSFLEG